jgi:peptidoglycan/xylan/chitin deacetylase (PgdA/CDA1 family)
MKIALKIDVDTLRGTREGVPRLADICLRRSANATFLFSVGPDHTGRALRRALHPGFLSKVRRTSVLRHYGLVTCLYGTLLPGPDIGMRCRSLMREIRDQGFETGIHAFDHVLWQDKVSERDSAWTLAQMRAAYEKFHSIFDQTATVHGAAGWQMNGAAFLAEDLFGFTHASDTRGSEPFFPKIGGTIVDCLQLPTTLPTLDELIGRDDLGGKHPVDHLLELTANSGHRDHVYTLHAELEGQQLAPWLERLMSGWQEQGYRLTSLGELAASIDRGTVPIKAIRYRPIAGRSGTLAIAS